MNIILIGFMTSGKSSVANLLAKKLGLTYLDIDHLIEQNQNKSIPEIFKTEGEAAFRIYENQALKKIAVKDNLVVATGGGIVINEENRLLLKKAGIVVYLKVTAQDVLLRAGDYRTRPLLNHEDPLKRRQVIEDLLKKRENWYLSSADLVLVSQTGNPEKNVEDIVRYINEQP